MAVLPRPSGFCIVEAREFTHFCAIILALMKMVGNVYVSLNVKEKQIISIIT